jgi:hypothetical protein
VADLACGTFKAVGRLVVLVIQVSLVAVESSWAAEIAIYIVRERLVLVPATQTNVTLFCGAGELV